MAARRDILILLAILALALVLRLVGLNGPLWYDEITTIVSHLRLPWGQMFTDYEMNHHYLFSAQAKLAAGAFGEAPWSVRLPALIFGVATVWAIWLLAAEVADSPAAHVAGLLAALSYHQIWFSQNARGYTEMAFWGTLGILLFLRGLKSGAWAYWFGFATCLALSVLTHLTAVFLFVALGLVWLAHLALAGAARDWRRDGVLPLAGFALGLVAVLILFAPLLSSFLTTLGGVAATSEVDVMTEYRNPVWTVLEGIRTAVGGGVLMPVAGLGALVVIVTGAASLQGVGRWLGWIVLLHVLLTVALLTAVGMRIWPRFFFVDIGLAFVLIAAGVRQFCIWFGRWLPAPLTARNLFGLAIVAMVALSALMAARNYAMPKQDMAGAVAYANGVRGAGETVISLGVAAPIFDAYFTPGWVVAESENDLRAELAALDRAILVIAFPDRTYRSFPVLEYMKDQLQTLTVLPGTLGDGAIVIVQWQS